MFNNLAIPFLIAVFFFSFSLVIWIICTISEFFGFNFTTRQWYDYMLLIGILAISVMLCLLITPVLLAHMKNFIKKQLNKYNKLLKDVDKSEQSA